MTTLSWKELQRDEDVMRLPPSIRLTPDPERARKLEEQRRRALAELGDRWLLAKRRTK